MRNAEHSSEFGRLLREFRIGAGLTQEALAERAGLGRRSVQALERGESGPQRATVQRLIEVLALAPPERERFEAAARPSPRHRRPADTPEPIRLLTDARASPRHNLPVQLTSFVGREAEIHDVKVLLATSRLVTLTGSGGCGKTRLAQQVATGILADYPDGVWLAELAPLADPALIPRTIANALGLDERPDQPVLSMLTSFLQSRHCLLILDNCEHLIDACARVATALLQACPNLTILATSRLALQVSGEVQWRVPSLSTPEPTSFVEGRGNPEEVVSRYPAIRLFAERARAVQPPFALTAQILPAVAQICWRLDGMPLAIELAAARVNVLSVATIAERLGQRFQLLTVGSRVALPRQQTLRATIDWSFELLAESERVLFRRLAVFAGSFTPEAAEGICAGDGLVADDILSSLLRLVDQSLVEVGGGEETTRYRVLETIREYADERLAAAGEVDALQRRHYAWYLAWAKDAEPRIWGVEQKIWLDRFEREHDNLRAALRFCREKDVASGLRLAWDLHRFWLDQGHLVEGQRWLEDLLERGTESENSRALALVALGRLRVGKGDARGALSPLEEGLAGLRVSGQPRDVAYALVWQGTSLLIVGEDDPRAQLLFEEGYEASRLAGSRGNEAVAVARLGTLALLRGENARARECYTESLSLFREMEGHRGIAWGLRCLANLARLEGNVRQARVLLVESLTLAWEVGHGVGVAAALTVFGVAAQEDGDWPCAIRLIAAASRDSLPVPSRRMEGVDWEASLAICRTALGDEAFAHAWAEGQAMTLEKAVSYALDRSSSP